MKPAIMANKTMPVHAISRYAVIVGLTLYSVRFFQFAFVIAYPLLLKLEKFEPGAIRVGSLLNSTWPVESVTS